MKRNSNIGYSIASCYPNSQSTQGKLTFLFKLRSACVLTTMLAASQVVLATDLLELPTAPGFNGRNSLPLGINGNGNVIVGSISDVRDHAFRWNALSGKLDDLGFLPGGTSSKANAVNADGNVVVGQSNRSPGRDNPDNGPLTHAFRWTQAEGMKDLGTLGGLYSEAFDVNAVGDVVVGTSSIRAADGGYRRAFRWTEAGGMQDLGTLGGGNSDGQGVNADGTVVVGASTYAGGPLTKSYAFRWTEAEGMKSLGTIAGDNSKATAVNAAGDVVVGNSTHQIGNDSQHAFRWTEAEGMKSLGTLDGDSTNGFSSAAAVNKAGDVVVGMSTDEGARTIRAFRWAQATGMQSIEAWLASHGLIVKNTQTQSATGVNDDGNAVIGFLANGNGFLARVTPGGAGMIDVSEFNTGLYRVANSALLAINDADLVMHGAHGNPMRTLLPVGRSSFWAAGDAGKQEHGVYDNKQGVAEIGYGYRPSQTMQFNVALGRTYSSSDTGFDGDTTARSTYVLPELILSVPDSSTKATLSAYYGQGDLRIDRAYLNAGNLTHAYAKPDTETFGARVRLDWVDAITAGKTNLTPYTSLTYMETGLDAYTEQGNGFPAQWNKRTEHATTARIGVDAVHPVSGTVTVVGRLEATHRFENQGTTASGRLLGVGGYAFSFRGQDLNKTWFRAGLGLEAKVGNGIASAMLNATTQGEMPTYWLAASYRWLF
ncbi:autotransporter [Janthinobacterium sp. Marseille]|nr:autotransporter domain-containing protein [Janthinobacterium sp. Marseille]ABR90262.1 autotransporter [Janthinobacterium sp. Marseille]